MSEYSGADSRQRAIFTNDGECDDMNSLVHLLLYANDIDIEGIVLSSSIFHYAGDEAAGVAPHRWPGHQWMWGHLDAYEQVYANLRVHDPRYPSPAHLRSITCVGNVKTTGCMDEDTDGSRLVCERILVDDPRPLWLLAGGGTNTIAAALRSIEERWRGRPEWDEVYRRVCDTVCIFMIITQDDSYRDYIVKSWPDIPLIHCTSLGGVGYLYDETMLTPRSLAMYQGDWMYEHLISKGPLLARLNTWGDGHVYPGERPGDQFGSNPELMKGAWWGKVPHARYDMLSEGDSPSFMHLVNRGLRQHEDPSYGGWGGRFERRGENEFGAPAYWTNVADEAPEPIDGLVYQFTRWAEDWMREYAARADWCVTPRFEDANHAPSVSVVEGVDLAIAAGSSVVLHAVGNDPDGDELGYQWFRYADADTCDAEVAMHSDGAVCTLEVPGGAHPGDTIHLVCRVSDDGHGASDLPLASYARIIITVR